MSKKEMYYLREKVKKYLDNYSGNEKVIISKEILEALLFEIVTVRIDGKCYQVKVPVWSGEFLSKVDLGEISFVGVLWNYDICTALNGRFHELTAYIYQMKRTNPFYTAEPFEICYVNTNAQIDLTESFLFNFGITSGVKKYVGLISVARCNFSGTNVRIGDKEVKAIQFFRSSFAGSNIFIPETCHLTFNGTDLSGNNLSHLHIDGLSNDFYDSNFRNSGINIHLDLSALEKYVAIDGIYSKILKMLNDYFVGCSVNGICLDYHEDEEYNLSLILKDRK